MLPNINPKQLKKMMKQMGMDMNEIPASEVIIKKTDGTEIKISNPQVQKMKVPGQGESFQITGNVSEIGGSGAQGQRGSGEETSDSEPADESTEQVEISEEDINIVAEQAKVPKEKAKEALEKAKGDIAKAILELQKK